MKESFSTRHERYRILIISGVYLLKPALNTTQVDSNAIFKTLYKFTECPGMLPIDARTGWELAEGKGPLTFDP